MRNFLFFITVFGVGLLFQLIMPWWSLALAVLFLVVFVQVKPFPTLGLAFLAGLLIWGGFAFVLDGPNNGLLAERMGRLFGNIGRWGMLGATAFIGGLLALLAAWTGMWARRLFLAR